MVGVILVPLVPLVQTFGFSRDSSLGIVLFGLIPLLLVVLGLWCPGLAINLLGLVLVMLGWSLGYTAASLVMGFGSIRFNLAVMTLVVMPAYIVLVLAVFVVARCRRGWRRGA